MRKFIIWCFWIAVNFGIIGIIAVGYLFYINSQDLPSYEQLEKYEPPIVTRFYATDGKLLEEYAKEHRIFLPINSIPPTLRQAFISAEDQNFYSHPGVDFMGILRAAIKNAIAMAQGRKELVGGSTITQQVVKNFLLTNEKSINRKIKEAILAFRISKALSKDKILELYLNEIFLGSRSYGVASAALNYFNKSVNELSIEESALLASLPQAPSRYNPRTHMEEVLDRRNWVIKRMYDEDYISEDEAREALSKPITLANRDRDEVATADFFAETVRQKIAQMYGKESLYEGGLMVRTSLDPKLEKIAEKALRNGLIRYDQKYGYRGAIARIDIKENWAKKLASINPAKMDIKPWRYAVILKLTETSAKVGFANGKKGSINIALSKWALKGRKLTSMFKPGDVITLDDKNAIQQIPRINGSLVAMDPHTGRVLALVGGYSFDNSKFNRATQAFRQPGSSFKPFVYLAALEAGFTPSSIFLDTPIEMEQGPGLPLWKPQNFYHDFLGPLTLRRGLELSRNTITVRIAEAVGIGNIVEIAKRFGINKDPQPYYSMALGALETTVLQLTNAYAVIANGGRKVTPTLIDKIQDRHGKLIFSNDKRICVDCNEINGTIPFIQNNNPYVTDPRSAYQLTSILEGVVLHTRTGLPIRQLGRTIAGKTGTSNGPKDTWFIGFTPDLVVGVFVGYDNATKMGTKESGATAAQPIFVEFMKEALADQADKSFKIPDGIKLVRTDYMSGEPSMKYGGTIYEAFKRKNYQSPIEIQKAVVDDSSLAIEEPQKKDDDDEPEVFSLDEIQDDGIY
ncbi:MAG: penicillin-binding protein 1A [Rickettsiales bacterium]|nr:penicillin-binding protein 1A [Rickettsiales bacterium]